MGKRKNIERSAERIAAALESNTPTRARDTSRHQSDVLPLLAKFRLWMSASEAQTKAQVAMRRSYPITGFVGPNGGGKSLAMIATTLPSLDAGRRVLSTVRLLAEDGSPHPSYTPFVDFDQLLDAEHCDVLMDEIVGIANSRDGGKLPTPVQNLLVQLRRRDVVLRWTAPNWARADKIIREVTQAVVECRGFYPGKAAPVDPDNPGSELRVWSPKRVFQFRTFDTVDFEEWTSGKRDKLTPLGTEWFKGVGSRAFSSYDTLDAVSMVTHGEDEKKCSGCGKSKRQEYCKGHSDEELESLVALRTNEREQRRLDRVEKANQPGSDPLTEAEELFRRTLQVAGLTPPGEPNTAISRDATTV